MKAMIAVPCPPLEVLSDQEAWKVPVEEVMTYAARPCTPEPELKSWRLAKDPDVSVEVGSETYDATALVTEGAERQRLWDMIVERYPFFVEHQAKTTRQIPIIALQRRQSS